MRLTGTKIEFTYDFAELLKEQVAAVELKKPIVYMMANTYMKMLQYVLKCDVEIAWRGTVERGTGDKNHHFFIKDVFLYPQKVTGATVVEDADESEKWLATLPNEIFNKMRFQGHSHVNMGTFYSGTDIDNNNRHLQDLAENDFYIFMVMNKKQDILLEIYDLAQNAIYEKEDISFKVFLDKENTLGAIDAEMADKVKKPTYSTNYGIHNYGQPVGFRDDDYYDQYERDYHQRRAEKIGAQTTFLPKTAPVKVKRHVVLNNRNGRNFEMEHREYEGENIDLRFNGKDYNVFCPYKEFRIDDIRDLRSKGWHVREMPIPEDIPVD